MTKVFTVLRAAFGVALFASIAVIYSAIIAISVSGSDRDRDDRRRGDSFGGGFGGGFGFGPSLYYGPSRLGEGLVSRRKTFDILKVLMNLDEKNIYMKIGIKREEEIGVQGPLMSSFIGPTTPTVATAPLTSGSQGRRVHPRRWAS